MIDDMSARIVAVVFGVMIFSTTFAAAESMDAGTGRRPNPQADAAEPAEKQSEPKNRDAARADRDTFKPSERISAENAVDFPADI